MTAELVHRASHDAVTELPSRVLFTERLEQELDASRSGSGSGEVSVLELDMDGFKEVNDMFGHACGDLVLLEVARRVTSTVGPRGHGARMGGDEYAVLLVGADADAADETAVRLAEVLVGAVRTSAVPPWTSRSSIGIATGRDPATTRRRCCATRTRRCTTRRSSGSVACGTTPEALDGRRPLADPRLSAG